MNARGGAPEPVRAARRRDPLLGGEEYPVFNRPFGIAPADVRFVFGDTETITIAPERREVWEGAFIVRDPGNPDVEIEWQLRPNLIDADGISLRIGGYYRRNRALALRPGDGILVVAPDLPELDPDDDGMGPEPADKGKPDGRVRYRNREITSLDIADRMAPLLDGAFVIGEVPSFDDVALHKFLRDNGQFLTTSHRLQCINNLILGYLHGKAATLTELGRTDDEKRLLAEKLYAEIPTPPWDPEKLSRLVGVEPPPIETRHRALVDARWVRDRFDAITGGRFLPAVQ